MRVAPHSRGLPSLLKIKTVLGVANTPTSSHSLFFFLPLIIHHKQKFPRPSKRCECAFGRWHCAASLPVGGRECSGVSLTSLFRGHSALVWIQKLLYSAPSDALSWLSVLTRYACLCLPSFSLRVRPFEVGLSRQPELSYTCH